jgi:hypothetical protein
MPETTSAAETQAADVTLPQEGTSPVQAAEPTIDPVALQRELAEARREAVRYRTVLRKVTDAQLSETERLQRRVIKLEAITVRDRERAIMWLTMRSRSTSCPATRAAMSSQSPKPGRSHGR